jgi:hypothetical protein
VPCKAIYNVSDMELKCTKDEECTQLVVSCCACCDVKPAAISTTCLSTAQSIVAELCHRDNVVCASDNVTCEDKLLNKCNQQTYLCERVAPPEPTPSPVPLPTPPPPCCRPCRVTGCNNDTCSFIDYDAIGCSSCNDTCEQLCERKLRVCKHTVGGCEWIVELVADFQKCLDDCIPKPPTPSPLPPAPSTTVETPTPSPVAYPSPQPPTPSSTEPKCPVCPSWVSPVFCVHDCCANATCPGDTTAHCCRIHGSCLPVWYTPAGQVADCRLEKEPCESDNCGDCVKKSNCSWCAGDKFVVSGVQNAIERIGECIPSKYARFCSEAKLSVCEHDHAPCPIAGPPKDGDAKKSIDLTIVQVSISLACANDMNVHSHWTIIVLLVERQSKHKKQIINVLVSLIGDKTPDDEDCKSLCRVVKKALGPHVKRREDEIDCEMGNYQKGKKRDASMLAVLSYDDLTAGATEMAFGVAPLLAAAFAHYNH